MVRKSFDKGYEDVDDDDEDDEEEDDERDLEEIRQSVQVVKKGVPVLKKPLPVREETEEMDDDGMPHITPAANTKPLRRDAWSVFQQPAVSGFANSNTNEVLSLEEAINKILNSLERIESYIK